MLCAITLCILSIGNCLACVPLAGSPKVATAERAIEIAHSAWKGIEWKKGSDSIYGPTQTSRFEPYTAVLQDNEWIVRGTLPIGFHGETMVTTICAADESAFAMGVIVK